MTMPQPASDQVYDRAAFADEFAVSRETLERLDCYAGLLADWQEKMNLVGPSTLPNIWNRHFRDSAQLLGLLPPAAHKRLWLDIGAGGGFPGLVVAAMGGGIVHQVESIAKKARFLEAATQAMGLAGVNYVHNCRVEQLKAFPVDVITARACAALEQLFDWGLPFAARSTCWLLPKGESVEAELEAARRRFTFDARLVPSRSDPRGRIVVATAVKRKGRA